MNKLRYSAIGCAVPVLIYVLLSMINDIRSPLFAKGKIQTGHENIDCEYCHQKTAGTARQQIQANVHYMLGLRETDVDFGFSKVSSGQCLECHERPNERHPIYRFQEPRFARAIEQTDATSCLGCHSEHQDRKANDDITFCQNCHTDLILKNDPLDVSHDVLIADKQWDTCLGCHDYHGNHVEAAPKKLEARHAVEVLRDYLAAGPSPYGTQRHFEAKQP